MTRMKKIIDVDMESTNIKLNSNIIAKYNWALYEMLEHYDLPQSVAKKTISGLLKINTSYITHKTFEKCPLLYPFYQFQVNYSTTSNTLDVLQLRKSYMSEILVEINNNIKKIRLNKNKKFKITLTNPCSEIYLK